ncbi:two component transcriptional regulator, LytTR family [Dethiosulfatibacter aminovorans DSM 17477]|uniref:Two component transcriptional regulator, LytTR family n=1 Tax=Dethiosulfatibacter aminovorans DSM 17477 TaxID=1121476 RepID=A0A1M6IJL2_9FIRM|nr:LytTR family DNA-binding domain-containing protein [Dethiosulfatibacter aminovorans]SHJ34587.1 two component transcriptional regulator, LytTR family [Dethiosulfatibacter aminovorans DSM 17477]
MAKIIIIEDEAAIRNDLAKTIRKIDEHIEIFETGSVLESMEIIQENDIDIFLIDIQLEDGNGYELAKRIRKIDSYKLNHIVFITAVPTHAMMAYENIHCYSYILKPIDQDLLEEQLFTLIKFGTKRKDSDDVLKLELELKSCKYVVNVDDIIYLEAINQKKYLKTTKDCIELTRTSMAGMMNRLPDYFIRCHKSFIINKNRIEYVDKARKVIRLNDIDEMIPIGRKYYVDIMEAAYEVN